MTARAPGRVDGDGQRRSLDPLGTVALPGGVRGFTVERGDGPPELLLILPAGVSATLEAGSRWSSAAVVRPDGEFSLVTPTGCFALRYRAFALPRAAAALGAARCDICRIPLAPDATVVVCAGCGAIACHDCVSARQCVRCGAALEASDD
jgi:hypothetical protein